MTEAASETPSFSVNVAKLVPFLQLRHVCAGIRTAVLGRAGGGLPRTVPLLQQTTPSPSLSFSTEPAPEPPNPPPRKPAQTHGLYPGDNVLQYTSQLEVVNPEKVRKRE